MCATIKTMRARVHVLVSGRVQGVFFRGYAERWGSSLGLTGWVRNLWDRRIEIVAEGEKPGLEQLLDRLRIGPPSARVEGLEVHWEEPRDEFSDFRIVHSH
jgi:acylphosphatase